MGLGRRPGAGVYLGAALVLPLVAVAAEAIAQQWRRATPVLVVLFLLPVPFNLTGFDAGVHGECWMARREYVFTTAVRMPFAPDVRPLSDRFYLDPVTIGFLLDATAEGRLTPSTIPLTPQVINEFKVRLGIMRRVHAEPPVDCRTYDQPLTLTPRQGDVLHLASDVTVATLRQASLDRRFRSPVRGGATRSSRSSCPISPSGSAPCPAPPPSGSAVRPDRSSPQLRAGASSVASTSASSSAMVA